MQGNLILTKSGFSSSIEGAGGNLWGALSEEGHPSSRAPEEEGSAPSGLQRLLKALNPQGCGGLTAAGGGAALHLLP